MMMPHTGWGTPPPAHFCFFSASFSSWPRVFWPMTWSFVYKNDATQLK
jgi:hypothetical protein